MISAPRALIGGAVTGPAAVLYEQGRIVAVTRERPPPGPGHLRLDGGILTPGLVDLQINGGFGVDFLAAGEADWVEVARLLLATGVTAFQPTFITAPLGVLAAGLERAAAVRRKLEAGGVAQLLGVHLEGPFLSTEQPGVHDVTHMREPTPEAVERLLTAGRRACGAAGAPPGEAGLLTMITIAPELPGAIAAVRRFVQAGVRVSVGHSNAYAAQVAEAAAAGASMVTHVFNAQRGLGHREPGVAGQALADPRLAVGLIADLRHVAAPVCRIVMAAARGRVALVTDAVAAAGMPPGRYELAGQVVEVSGDDLPRRPDGRIAGSALLLDQAVRNLAGLGCDLAEVLDAATRVPAGALGRDDLGRLAPGARADLVLWGDDLRPRRVWIAGEEAWRRPDPA